MTNKSNDTNTENLQDINNEKNSLMGKVSNIYKKFIAPMEGATEKKLGYLLGVMFLSNIYIYTVSRLVKDNLLVAKLSSDVIPFMKNVVAFSAVIFGVIYVLGISFFNRRTLFNITLFIFLIFFAGFGLLFFPFQQNFLLSETTVTTITDWLGGSTGNFFVASKFVKMGIASIIAGLFFSLTHFNFKNLIKNIGVYGTLIFGGYTALFNFAGPKLAHGLRVPVQILKVWPYALYYIFSEMWGAYALGLLFWNFANYQCSRSEATRIYTFLALIGQIGQIAAGYTVEKYVQSSNFITIISICVTLCGLLVFFLHEYIFRSFGRETNTKVVNKKQKAGFKESLKAMMSSPIILFASIIVLFYGISCNILETYWKNALNLLAKSKYPNAADELLRRAYFSIVQAKMIQWVGYIAIVSGLFSNFFLTRMGWRFSALITPVTVAVGSFVFFGLDLFSQIKGTSALLALAMMAGTIALIFVKATKYTIFDNTKEILLVSLPTEAKSQAKVADSLAGRWGKTFGGQSLLLLSMIGGGLNNMPVKIAVFVLIGICAISWIAIVFKLSFIESKIIKEEEQITN